MSRFLSIGEASKILGVSVGTLRRWEKEGRIASVTTSEGHRRFDISVIQEDGPKTSADDKLTVCYARVSSHDQAEDLKRQKEVLELYAAARGWTFEIISDLGSGMNYSKKGLRQLLNMILDDRIGRLVITHKDRLLRFGAELVFSICESKSVEVVIINLVSFQQALLNSRMWPSHEKTSAEYSGVDLSCLWHKASARP